MAPPLLLNTSAFCKMSEIALVYDQLDLGSLAAFELGARRLQAIHDKWTQASISKRARGYQCFWTR